MNEYVKKEKVELALTADVADMSIEDYISLISKRIKALPAADVKPIVRCKYCKHRDPENKHCDSGGLERAGNIFPVSDDYFCAYGEKGN